MTVGAVSPTGGYRALTIGVSEFVGYRTLDYATTLAAELRDELTALGYAAGDPVPADCSSEQLGAAVRDSIRSASASDVLVVHVLSHGEVSDGTSKLYVLGGDGTRHDLADVEGWLAAVQDGPHPPLVLFVLDICQSGAAARLPWQGASADGSARAWVIAACGPQEQAYGGRLTRATATVLQRLREGKLDIAPGVEYVPLDIVGREIRKEVVELTRADSGLPQQVTGTQLDITADLPNLPFFKNPAYSADPLLVMRGREESALAEFADGIGEPAAWGTTSPRNGTARDEPVQATLAWASGSADLPDDPDLSASFWADRTRGHGLIAAAPDAGCFSGRTAELSELVPWMMGYGGKPHTLSVVTGGPGVGKSALLGVLVCAAHPKLRDATRPLWSRARQVPGQLDHLVAVHARQRDLAGVTACLARQLAPVLATDIAAITDPAKLVAAVAAATAPVPAPVIVLDALDEAIGSQRIINELILPLAAASRVDGASACRVLVGSRPYGVEFESLLDTARAQGGLVDLDTVDRTTLAHDLGDYVAKLLETQPGYRDKFRISRAFGSAVADSLTGQHDDRRWGEFLVAGLYTHSVLRDTAAEPMKDLAEADRRGARCPRTIPEVLNLDLAARPNQRDLLEVLQIVALARGAGMPASVIDRCRGRRPTFGDWTPTLRALAELGFYLRRANDDGTTLYRVFHEGLADHLRPSGEEPEDEAEILLRVSQMAWEPAWSRRTAEQAILDAMLAALGPKGARRWDLAEPYVLRHALDHAQAADTDLNTLITDPEFLIHADPSLPAALQHIETTESLEASWFLTNVESVLAPTDATRAGPPPLARRRAAMALLAARAGNPALAEAFAEPPAGSPEPHLSWQPRWTAGDHAISSLSPADRQIPSLMDLVSSVTSGVIKSTRVVALGYVDGRVEVRSLADNRQIHESRIESGPWVIWALDISEEIGIVSVDGQGTLRITDIETGAEIVSARNLEAPLAKDINAVRLGHRVIGAVVHEHGAITFVDVPSGRVLDQIPADEAGIDVTADGKGYRLTQSYLDDESDSRKVNVEAEGKHFGALTHGGDPLNALTSMILDGYQVAVTGGEDRTVRFWDVPTLSEIERLEVPAEVESIVPAGDDYLAVLCGGEVIIYQRRKPARPATPPEGEA